MARQTRPNGTQGSTFESTATGGTGFGLDASHGFSKAQTSRPSAEEIRKRAYELFCARKGRGGSPEEDWLRAERELTGRTGPG